jgi:glycosyltransferase involved in cell wall biosynthesis
MSKTPQDIMILGKKLIVIMPAYNAARTLRQTYEELPHEYVDEVILVDDASKDETSKLAEDLGIKPSSIRRTEGMAGTKRPATRKH